MEKLEEFPTLVFEDFQFPSSPQPTIRSPQRSPSRFYDDVKSEEEIQVELSDCCDVINTDRQYGGSLLTTSNKSWGGGQKSNNEDLTPQNEIIPAIPGEPPDAEPTSTGGSTQSKSSAHPRRRKNPDNNCAAKVFRCLKKIILRFQKLRCHGRYFEVSELLKKKSTKLNSYCHLDSLLSSIQRQLADKQMLDQLIRHLCESMSTIKTYFNDHSKPKTLVADVDAAERIQRALKADDNERMKILLPKGKRQHNDLSNKVKGRRSARKTEVQQAVIEVSSSVCRSEGSERERGLLAS